MFIHDICRLDSLVMVSMCCTHLLEEQGELGYASVEVIGLPSCLEEETLRNGEKAFITVPEQHGVYIGINLLAGIIVYHVDILVAASVLWDIDDAPVGNNQPFCPVVPERSIASQQEGLFRS